MKTKSVPAAKSKPNKEACNFVREQVINKMVQAGWTVEKAQCVVDCCDDSEIQAELGEQKVGALGDGRLLGWLKDHKSDILNAVNNIFTLLTLFGDKAATRKDSGGKVIDEDEDEEEEDEDK